MNSDNNIISIKYGALILSYLSQNPETHDKILNAGSPLTLSNLIKKNIHYEVYYI
jgi:hypothetical protein